MNELACFLSKLIRAQLYKEQLPQIPEGVTVEQLVNIAQENQMVYLILGALLQLDIDEKYMPSLKQIVLRSMSKTLMQVNELKSLLQVFEEQGIVNQQMKGSVMKYIYPSPELREMGDIDILINEADMDKAAEIFQQKGYKLTSTARNHDVYIKAPFMCVEAHRALYDKDLDNVQYEYFKDISKRVLRDGCQYTYDFSKEDFYVYMMAHMAKHFHTKGCGIRNLVDIHVYNQKYSNEMDRAYIEQELDRCGILAYTEHMERLTQIWFGEEESTPFYDNLFEYMLNSGIYGKTENSIWTMVANEQSRGQISRWQVVQWNYFPTYEYMVECFPWLEGKTYLLPFAWGIRAFRGVFKRKRLSQRENVLNFSKQDIQRYGEIYHEMKLPFYEKH